MIGKYYRGFKLDFRPYMILNPVTVFTTDSIINCVQLFRSMALRHLLVIHPSDAKLRGVITRQDLFKYMDL